MKPFFKVRGQKYAWAYVIRIGRLERVDGTARIEFEYFPGRVVELDGDDAEALDYTSEEQAEELRRPSPSLQLAPCLDSPARQAPASVMPNVVDRGGDAPA